jgi:hypothetical protein
MQQGWVRMALLQVCQLGLRGEQEGGGGEQGVRRAAAGTSQKREQKRVSWSLLQIRQLGLERAGGGEQMGGCGCGNATASASTRKGWRGCSADRMAGPGYRGLGCRLLDMQTYTLGPLSRGLLAATPLTRMVPSSALSPAKLSPRARSAACTASLRHSASASSNLAWGRRWARRGRAARGGASRVQGASEASLCC